MHYLKLSKSIILAMIVLLAYSCNNSTGKQQQNQATSSNPAAIADSSITKTEKDTNTDNDSATRTVDTPSGAQQNNNTDSMLSQMKNLTSIFGKSDSGILKNVGGKENMDSMMKKMQSMLGDGNANPGDAIAKSLLNLQMGQMSDNNPLKSVAKGMMEAQENGTAGPSKTYNATYTPEQSVDYAIPISGNGNTVMLHYTGGSIATNKKDGLWKNIYVNTNKGIKWNVYTESYAESSALNMKVHATSLASINENYSIILNDQYKKYNKQHRSDLGKNEYDLQVQKMGIEKLFGYSCVHVKISYTLKALGQTTHTDEDEWYSTDVPGSQFLSPLIFENHSPASVKKILDAGCAGTLVKSVVNSSGASQLIQLSSIVQKDMPDSIFRFPPNYIEDKNTALYNIQ